MLNLGIVKPGSTIYIPFESFASATGAPITLTGLAVGDIKIYKDGGVTERASTNGFTLLDTDGIDFDSLTGIHGVSIDLSDNSTADFYQAGSRYFVVIGDVTVDSQTMRFIAARFEIGYEAAIHNTFIATLSSQTSFTLNAGPAEDDALNGCWAVIHDAASAVQKAVVLISDYTGSSKTVALAVGATFTVAAKDNFSIMGPMPLQPTVGAIQSSGRTLDVSTGGEAGVDWANVGSPTTTVGLSGTTVKTATDVEADTQDIQSRLPAALVSGRIDSSVGAMAANVMTAAATAADYVTELQAGLSTLDAAGIRTAVGLASANLDTQLTTIDDFLDTEIAAIKAKTDNLPASPAAVGSAMTLTSGERDSIASALLDLTAGVETNRTLRQALRIILAALAGKLSGAATTSIAIRDTNDTKDRITATVDGSGNRSSVTLDGT